MSEIWVIFSDPYIKKERKRLTSPKFLELYRKIAKRGISINLKTDSDLLYEFTHEVIEEENLEIYRDIKDVYEECPDDPQLSIQTYYEKMHLKNGKKIKFISFGL